MLRRLELEKSLSGLSLKEKSTLKDQDILDTASLGK
jgi:hypothetical protein